METQDENKHRQRIRNHRIGLVVLAAVLILTLVAIFLFVSRIGKLNEEQQQLQTERTSLIEERSRKESELIRSDSILAELRTDLEELAAENEENLIRLSNQAAGIKRRSAENQILAEQLENYRLMEEEYKKMQSQYSILLGEYENLDLSYDKLQSKYTSLQDSVEQSKGLKAFNINLLNKWERWLWADRYNVSLAKRIDKTEITFEIWGSLFTPSGERTVYISMIDPSGSVLYPAPAETEISATGEGLPYTKKQLIDFSGDPVPLAFTIEHPEELSPGFYTIKVYVNAEEVGSEQILFE